jgi:hypothetical protein
MDVLQELPSPAMSFQLPGKIKFQEARVVDVIEFGKAAGMFEEHWREVGIWKNERPLDPDWDAYKAAAERGLMKAWVATKDGLLKGYASYAIARSLNYKGWVTATNGIFYLDPEMRRVSGTRRWFAFEFFETADLWLKTIHGVNSIRYATKVGKTHTDVFKQLGYETVEEVWEKVV